MPGLSQTDCLADKGSEGDRGPCAACQSAKYVSNWVSAVQADANKICDWRSEVTVALCGMYPKRLFGDKLLVNSLNVFVTKIVSTNVA